ncbi:MAG: hypothetical protein JST92_15070 [Deltaproteobacteria bacterium]|nr:hypothetical protein [Deltaproteobacteria bacterium]
MALTLVLFLGLTSLGDRLRLRIDLRALFLLALTVFGAVASLRCATRYAGTGRSALAHAHAVYDLMLPGLFWPALALHLAALALALWLAAKALPIARKA